MDLSEIKTITQAKQGDKLALLQSIFAFIQKTMP